MKKIENIIFISLVILIISGGFIKTFIKPSDINFIENRRAYIFPTFSINSFIDKSFQSNVENAFSDQIPLSNKMKLSIKNANIFLKLQSSLILSKNHYYPIDSVYSLYKNNIVYNLRSFADTKEILDQRIRNINDLAEKLNDVDIYTYYIEKDTDINLETNEKLELYNYMKDNLNNTIKSGCFTINNIEDFYNYYYKTDHHWNYKGSYKGYQEIIKMLNNEEPLLYEKELHLNSEMTGSKALIVGGSYLFKEKFSVYTFKFPDHDIYINNKKVSNYGNYQEIIKNQPESINYGDYYGIDVGLLEMDYHQPEKENILILGDSFDNAINELLASHFNKTYNIDLRHYKKQLKEEFDIIKFAQEKNIQKILFVGNHSFFTNSVFLLKGVA